MEKCVCSARESQSLLVRMHLFNYICSWSQLVSFFNAKHEHLTSKSHFYTTHLYFHLLTRAFSDSVVIMYNGKKKFLCLSHYSFIKEKNVFLFINIVL